MPDGVLLFILFLAMGCVVCAALGAYWWAERPTEEITQTPMIATDWEAVARELGDCLPEGAFEASVAANTIRRDTRGPDHEEEQDILASLRAKRQPR